MGVSYILTQRLIYQMSISSQLGLKSSLMIVLEVFSLIVQFVCVKLASITGKNDERECDLKFSTEI